MRSAILATNHIVYNCFGMIKPQRAQRALRKKRERSIIPIPTDLLLSIYRQVAKSDMSLKFSQASPNFLYTISSKARIIAPLQN